MRLQGFLTKLYFPCMMRPLFIPNYFIMRSSPALDLALAGILTSVAATGCVDNTKVNAPNSIAPDDIAIFHTRFGDLEVQGHLDSYQARVLRGIDIGCALTEKPALEDNTSNSVMRRVVGFCGGEALNPPVQLGAVAVTLQCSGARGRTLSQGFVTDKCVGGFSLNVEIPSVDINVVFRPKEDFTGEKFFANVLDGDDLETVVAHTFGDGKNQSDAWWKEWQQTNQRSFGKTGNEQRK